MTIAEPPPRTRRPARVGRRGDDGLGTTRVEDGLGASTFHQPTVLGAVSRRPGVVIGIAVVCALLGYLAGTVGATDYRASAFVVVKEPSKGTEVLSGGSDAERFVTDQVSILRLESVATAAAELATEDLAELEQSQRTGAYEIADGTVRAGLDGSTVLGGEGGVTIGPDGSVSIAGGSREVLTGEGAVLAPNGNPVLDSSGNELVAGATDRTIIREDGLLALIDRRGNRTVVASDGTLLAAGENADATVGLDQPAGTAPVVINASDFGVRVDVDGTTVVTASDGGVTRPGDAGLVGAGSQLIVVTGSGAVAVDPDGSSVVVVGPGQALVLDPDRRLLANEGDVPVAAPPESEILPRRVITPEEVRAGLTVASTRESNMIEISFTDKQQAVPPLVANAVVEAYQDLLRSQATGTSTSALGRIEENITTLASELAETERTISSQRTSTESRIELTRQYEDTLAALADAGRAVLADTASTSGAAERLDDLIRQLNALEAVSRVEASQPEMAASLRAREEQLARLTALEQLRNETLLSADVADSEVTLFAAATESEGVAGLGGIRLAVVGGMFGLAIGAAVAYVLQLRRPQQIEDSSEPEAILGCPLLAEVPEFRAERLHTQLAVVDAPRSFVAEAYRFASTSLDFGAAAESRVIGVVSAEVGTGKTTVCANLALALTRPGSQVLALDADVEGQVLSMLMRSRFDIGEWTGLDEVLRGDRTALEAATVVEVDELRRLSLLGVGDDGEAVQRGITAGEGAHLFDALRESYDRVVVDVPPFLGVAYASKIAASLDGIIVVVSHHSSPRVLRELRQRLDYLGVPLLGYVYNKAPLRPERTASIPAAFYDTSGKRRRSPRPSSNRKTTAATTIVPSEKTTAKTNRRNGHDTAKRPVNGGRPVSTEPSPAPASEDLDAHPRWRRSLRSRSSVSASASASANADPVVDDDDRPDGLEYVAGEDTRVIARPAADESDDEIADADQADD